jgi:hypothetical protein
MATYPFKEVKAEYDNIAAVTTKNKFLRNQFSIRFHSCDWTEYQTVYSEDGEPRADAEVLKELEELMKREARVPRATYRTASTRVKKENTARDRGHDDYTEKEIRGKWQQIRRGHQNHVQGHTQEKQLEPRGVVFEVPEMQDLINKRVWFKWDEPDGWMGGAKGWYRRLLAEKNKAQRLPQGSRVRLAAAHRTGNTRGKIPRWEYPVYSY